MFHDRVSLRAGIIITPGNTPSESLGKKQDDQHMKTESMWLKQSNIITYISNLKCGIYQSVSLSFGITDIPLLSHLI